MKRLVSLVVVSSLALGMMIGSSRVALATPFSDVPANHWAYQYIQSLAADGIIDGYPDGKFKGDRPLTRYEMAVVVARAVAKLQENQSGVSKDDLEKLQKLIDALKDELDALGVRVTNLEDSLDALNKRTAFAQSLSLHGNINTNYSQRDRSQIPTSIENNTGSTVTTYYGQSIPDESVGAIDPFIQAYLASDDSNSPLTQANPQLYLRYDDRFTLNYQVNPNLLVSFPVDLLNYGYGGEFAQGNTLDVEPSVDVSLAKVGAITNLHIKYGIIDDMKSSRLGLTFKAPVGDQSPLFLESLQPFQRGFSVSGTLNGLTDFYGSFTRVSDVELNTIPTMLDQNNAYIPNAYLYPTVPQQAGYTQALGSGSVQQASFNAGQGTLAQVFLPAAAVAGSVFVSNYNGATFNATGGKTGGPPGSPSAPPAATFNSAYNAVVFNPALPAGSVVTLTFNALGSTQNENFQRYMITARINQKFKGYAGAEVGLSFNRIFDFEEEFNSGSFSQVFQQPISGYGSVSDTVLGIDFQAPIPYSIGQKGNYPVLYGEAAGSKLSTDINNTGATTDYAGVVGLKLKVSKVDINLQYQSVGAGYLDGAPYRYFGNPPPLFAYYKGPYMPDFFGFGNNVGINTQFDQSIINAGGASVTAQNPNLTYLTPIFNPFRGWSPTYFQAFAPNSRGGTVTATAPIRIGNLTFKTTGSYSHLAEIAPNSSTSIQFGPGYASSVPETFDTLNLGTSVDVPAFHKQIAVNLNGTYEHLGRNDLTAYQYYPFNAATQTFDPAAYANANAVYPPPQGGSYPNGGSQVSFYPNYVNVTHYVYAAKVSIPITTGVGLDLTYNSQTYRGANMTTSSQNISEQKNYYTGTVNYTIPKTNSTVGFTYRNYRYVDNVMPTYNFNQSREDVNFTIRF